MDQRKKKNYHKFKKPLISKDTNILSQIDDLFQKKMPLQNNGLKSTAKQANSSFSPMNN